EPVKEGLAPLPSRRLVSLSGPDAAKFLQGLITNNVDKNRESPFYAAFLDARGRVLWDVFVWVYPELTAKEGDWACDIEVDGGELEALLKHLKRHKLRSKVNIKIVEESEMGVWAGWGLSSADSIDGERVVASIIDPRGDSFGMRYLLKGSQPLENPPVPVVDTDQYHLRRYCFGIPEGPSEIPREAALPMEYNIDLSQGIDFKKGCYVGQELTIRTKHTGVVRKRVLPLVLKPLTSSEGHNTITPIHKLPEPGTDIKQLDENMGLKKGRAAGKFIAGIGNRGLGLARLEMMTSMRVSAEGGSWKPDAKFGIPVGNDEVMEVEALAPVEFRKRIWDLWDKNRTRV
ncbi:Aminomethyltransferase folate-binding domain-containing protein, partial [Periconia macrospinosa]